MNIISKLIKKNNEIGFFATLKLINAMAYRSIDELITEIVCIITKNRKIEDVLVFESHNDFDSNPGAFYRYLIENEFNRKYKIVWLTRNDVPNELPYNVLGYRLDKINIMKSYYLSVSKYLFFGHNMLKRRRSEQIACYMCHGSIGLKNARGKLTLPSDISYYLCPSSNLGKILADQFMIDYPNNKELIVGYPMLDVFYEKRAGDLSKLTNCSYNKVVLWMPTLRNSVDGRKDTNKDSPLGIPLIKNTEEYIDLNKLLAEENILLIIKIHPMQDLTKIQVRELSNIKILDGTSVKQKNIDNYYLMKDVDALISDYSSAPNDFLHADKPIAYCLDDMDDYKLGFIVEDPRTLMAGHLLYKTSDLRSFLIDIRNNRDLFKKERHELFNYIFDYHDGKSSERLIEYLKL